VSRSLPEETPLVVVPLLPDDPSARRALRGQSGHGLVRLDGLPIVPTTTTVRFAATPRHLLVLFSAEAEPPLLVKASAGGPVFRDECVGLFLAEPDRAAYLEIVTNPRGAVYGAHVLNPDDSRETWRMTRGAVPGLEVRVDGDPGDRPPSEWARWRCLLRLPWRSLPPGEPPPRGEVRRGNATRIARGATTRHEALAPTGRVSPADFHVPSRFARLLFERPG